MSTVVPTVLSTVISTINGTLSPGGANSLLFSALLQASLTPEKAKGSSTPTFTRATTATYVDTDGDVGTVSSGVARYQKLLGYLSESALTNEAQYSNDLSNAAWVKRGTATATQNQVGMTGAPNSATLISGLSTGNNDVYRIWSGMTSNAASAPRVFLKNTSGGTVDISIQNAQNGSKGEWTVDMSALSTTEFEEINADHAAVTVVSAFTNDGTSTGLMFKGSNTGVGDFVIGNAEYYDNKGVGDVKGRSVIFTSGSGVARNGDDLDYAAAGNITSDNATIALDWTPPATGMGTVCLWGSYVDANNYTQILHDGTNIVFRKRISGTNNDATKALSYAAGTTYRIAARQSDADGVDVFVDGVVGTNDSTTTALQLGSVFSIGNDGNGANHANAPIRSVLHYSKALSDSQVAAL